MDDFWEQVFLGSNPGDVIAYLAIYFIRRNSRYDSRGMIQMDSHMDSMILLIKRFKSKVPTENGSNNIAAQAFTFRELATATKNFRQECMIGEGGFGRVYKGKLERTGQIIAVKQLDRKGLQGNKEFVVEVLMLSLLDHPNLVDLIGYCADGEQRLLKPMDWYTRMKVALGAAKGLEYLHDKANPPVIYRDLKSSNILLDEHYNAKLSDFGLAKLGPVGDKLHVSTRVMGTYGYCAPEYQKTGHLTVKSDVYSFGVVFLELITGRRAIDTRRPSKEQNLVTWAQPYLKEPKKFVELADPLLEGQFPVKGLNQATAIASMCLQDEDMARPMMSDVVTALSFLSEELNISPVTSSEPSPSHDISSGGSNKVHPDEDLAPDLALERQRALAEALEWGQTNAMSRA
ncbi:hypothetical protein V2J09_018424 [Rumex salicifolius]